MRIIFITFILPIWGTSFITASKPMKEAAEAIGPIILKDGSNLMVGLYKVTRP